MSASTAKQEANRANAQLSTGPTSPEGKAKVSVNGVKTGFTGRTVLLPTDDVAAYPGNSRRMRPRLSASRRLQEEWRMMRIPELESSILTLDYRELADECADIEGPAARRSAINARPKRAAASTLPLAFT